MASDTLHLEALVIGRDWALARQTVPLDSTTYLPELVVADTVLPADAGHAFRVKHQMPRPSVVGDLVTAVSREDLGYLVGHRVLQINGAGGLLVGTRGSGVRHMTTDFGLLTLEHAEPTLEVMVSESAEDLALASQLGDVDVALGSADITYLVEGVRWRPSYTLHLTSHLRGSKKKNTRISATRYGGRLNIEATVSNSTATALRADVVEMEFSHRTMRGNPAYGAFRSMDGGPSAAAAPPRVEATSPIRFSLPEITELAADASVRTAVSTVTPLHTWRTFRHSMPGSATEERINMITAEPLLAGPLSVFMGGKLVARGTIPDTPAQDKVSMTVLSDAMSVKSKFVARAAAGEGGVDKDLFMDKYELEIRDAITQSVLSDAHAPRSLTVCIRLRESIRDVLSVKLWTNITLEDEIDVDSTHDLAEGVLEFRIPSEASSRTIIITYTEDVADE